MVARYFQKGCVVLFVIISNLISLDKMPSVSMFCYLIIFTVFIEQQYLVVVGQMTTGSSGVCMGDVAPMNGQADCYNKGLIQFCNVTCDAGYYFTGMHREETILVFQCSQGVWTPSVVPDCEAYDFCANVVCLYGGTCQDLSPGYRCMCAPGYEGDMCQTDTDDCQDDPCKNNGSCTDGVNLFVCDCTLEYAGQTCTVERRTATQPIVTSLIPNYGPVAGGTRITLIGTDFLSPVRGVLFGGASQEFRCTIVYSTVTTIVATTPPGSESFIGALLSVSVDNAGGWNVPTSTAFMYKANPVLLSVYPQHTIKEGCTTMTIRGDYLDSVITPTLEVTLDYSVVNKPSRRRVFTEPCCKDTTCTDEFRPKVIYCTTPTLEIPPEFLRAGQEDPLLNYDTSSRTLAFHVGIVFDGLVKYRNLSTVSGLEMFDELEVYRSPVLIEPDDAISFQANQLITIQGQDLDEGVPVGDYIVTVGESGLCTNWNLSESELTCLPPQDPPQRSASNTEDHHMIQVDIGCNIRRLYGHLDYDPSRSLPWVWLAVGVAGGLVIIVIAVAVTVIIYRRKRNNSSDQSDNAGNELSGNENQDPLVIMQEVFEQQQAKTQATQKPRNRMSQVDEYQMDLTTFLGPEEEGASGQEGIPTDTYEALGAREDPSGSHLYAETQAQPSAPSGRPGDKRRSRSLLEKLNELATYFRPKSRVSRMAPHIEQREAYSDDEEDPYVNSKIAKEMVQRAKKRVTMVPEEPLERTSPITSPGRPTSRHRVTMFPEDDSPRSSTDLQSRLQRASARDTMYTDPDSERELYMNAPKSTKHL